MKEDCYYRYMIMRPYIDHNTNQMRFKFDPENDRYLYFPGKSKKLAEMKKTYIIGNPSIVWEKKKFKFVDGPIVEPEDIDKTLFYNYASESGWYNASICKFHDSDHQFGVLTGDGYIRYIVQIDHLFCKVYQAYVGNYEKAVSKYGELIDQKVNLI